VVVSPQPPCSVTVVTYDFYNEISCAEIDYRCVMTF